MRRITCRLELQRGDWSAQPTLREVLTTTKEAEDPDREASFATPEREVFSPSQVAPRDEISAGALQDELKLLLLPLHLHFSEAEDSSWEDQDRPLPACCEQEALQVSAFCFLEIF